MAKVVKLGVQTPRPEKKGNRRVKKRRKPDLEDFGQLNLFDQQKIVSFARDDSFFDQALRLDEKGDERAEKFYEKAIQNQERVEDAWCNLAVLKSARKDHAGAIDCLTKCLERNPRHFEAHYNLGNVYSEIGNMPLARVHYELATQLAPEYPNSFYNLGLVLISQKDYQNAISCINKYVELSEENDTSTAKELINTLNAIAQ